MTDMKRAKAFYDAVLLTELQEDNTGPNPMATFPVKDMRSGTSGHLYPGKPAPGAAATPCTSPRPRRWKNPLSA